MFPKDFVDSLRSEYGDKTAESVAHAFAAKHPKRFAKMLRTARKRGHGGVLASTVRRRNRRTKRGR